MPLIAQGTHPGIISPQASCFPATSSIIVDDYDGSAPDPAPAPAANVDAPIPARNTAAPARHRPLPAFSSSRGGGRGDPEGSPSRQADAHLHGARGISGGCDVDDGLLLLYLLLGQGISGGCDVDDGLLLLHLLLGQGIGGGCDVDDGLQVGRNVFMRMATRQGDGTGTTHGG